MELTSINMKSVLTSAIAQTVWYWGFFFAWKMAKYQFRWFSRRNLIIFNLFFLNSRFFSAHINPRWVLLKGPYLLKPCSTLRLVLKQIQISFWLYCLLHWFQFCFVFFFFEILLSDVNVGSYFWITYLQ